MSKPKPVSIWIVQGLCVVFGASTLYHITQMDWDRSSFPLAAFGVLYLLLVVGLQLRHSWARWSTIVLLGLPAVGSLIAFVANASFLVPAIGILLVTLPPIALLAFGKPAKRYFAR